MLFSQLSISWGPLNAVRYVNIVTASVGRCEKEKNIYLPKKAYPLNIKFAEGSVAKYISCNNFIQFLIIYSQKNIDLIYFF